jgi:hypothetical protein
MQLIDSLLQQTQAKLIDKALGNDTKKIGGYLTNTSIRWVQKR